MKIIKSPLCISALIITMIIAGYGCKDRAASSANSGGGDKLDGVVRGKPLNLIGAVTTLGEAKKNFRWPTGITTDGKYLYIADAGYNIVSKMEISSGAITTLAGEPWTIGSTDGIGSAARFKFPGGITTDGKNIYVADTGNNTIRKIVISTGAVTTLAGTVLGTGSADGVGADARFMGPKGITTDGENLYVTDSYGSTIRKIVISSGAVSTLAGSAEKTGNTDGVGSTARFNEPVGITMDGKNLYVTEFGRNTIRKLKISTGTVTTLAGPSRIVGTFGFADNTGIATRYHRFGITTDGTYLYVADTINNTINKVVISSGAVSTLAGTTSAGAQAYSDGTGAAARFFLPVGITTDGKTLFVTDTGNRTIRKIR
jgi:hypothetical protein